MDEKGAPDLGETVVWDWGIRKSFIAARFMRKVDAMDKIRQQPFFGSWSPGNEDRILVNNTTTGEV